MVIEGVMVPLKHSVFFLLFFYWGKPWFDLFWTADVEIAEVLHRQRSTEHQSHLWSLIITEQGRCCPSWQTHSYLMGVTLCLQLQASNVIGEHSKASHERANGSHCQRIVTRYQVLLLSFTVEEVMKEDEHGTLSVCKSFCMLAGLKAGDFSLSSPAHTSQASVRGVPLIGWLKSWSAVSFAKEI